MGYHLGLGGSVDDRVSVCSHAHANAMKKNIIASLVFFVLGVCAIGGLLYATTRVVYRDRKIEKEIETLRQEAERIKNDNQVLSERIAYFETADFQEKIAKEKLNMQKEGEGVAIIKSSGQVEAEVSQEALVQAEPLTQVPNYRKWWNYFFEYKN